MREIVLDIETTGLDEKIDYIVEIGCVEIFDKMPTGNNFHVYVKPNKIMSKEVIDIHGITNEFLEDKEEFPYIAYHLLDFLSDSPVIAHNAEFDIKFINMELTRMGLPVLKNKIIDTLMLARKSFNTNNSLDSLAKRFKIDISHRKLHGALIDAELLSKVYYFLCCKNDVVDFVKNDNKNNSNESEFPIRASVSLTNRENELHYQILDKIKVGYW